MGIIDDVKDKLSDDEESVPYHCTECGENYRENHDSCPVCDGLLVPRSAGEHVCNDCGTTYAEERDQCAECGSDVIIPPYT